MKNNKEYFEKELSHLIHEDITINSFNSQMGKFILFNTEFGTIDFFPKKDKILIRKNNKWISNGINWMNKNLIKK